MKIKRLLFSTILALAITVCPAVAFCQSIDHKLAGDRYLKEGLFALAIAEYKEVLAVNPSSTIAYFNLAIAYYSQGDIEKASQTLKKLVERDPQDVEAQYNLGCLTLYQGDMQQAKLLFEKAKTCCDRDPSFKLLIDKGLEFIDVLKKKDPSTQNTVLFLLRQGIFSLPS